MKKFGIKFLFTFCLFLSFGSSSFAMSKNPTEIRNKIIDLIVDKYEDNLDIIEDVQKNLLGSIDTFVEDMDLLQIFSKKSVETAEHRLKLVKKFCLKKLAVNLGVSLNNCVNNILRECNEKIVSQVLNRSDADGITPLDLAVECGFWEMALELLNNGAYAFSVDFYGEIIDCALFDLNIFALNTDIPVEFIEVFKEYLIREIFDFAGSIDKVRKILSKMPFLGIQKEISRASLYRRLFSNTSNTN